MTEHIRNGPYTREYLAERLGIFRDGFSDEIPDRIVHSMDPDNMYKVRTVWFIGLANDLWAAKTEGVLPTSVTEDVDKFLLWYTDDFGIRSGNPVINTRADIEKGNEIINKVLESLGVAPKT